MSDPNIDNDLQYSMCGKSCYVIIYIILIIIVVGITVGAIIFCYEYCKKILTKRNDIGTQYNEFFKRTSVICMEDLIDDTCTICLEKIDVSDLVILNCNHGYHKDCMIEYISHSNDSNILCPNCRYKTSLV
uniref:RING-type domain-containing protein n=1 Tax=Megaviridae environmental sample TaxID=1737588 RepID=A0A5J6VL74_9VIRU|nr:MAG: hypothetical protein [Megaviridae environmental sample]